MTDAQAPGALGTRRDRGIRRRSAPDGARVRSGPIARGGERTGYVRADLHDRVVALLREAAEEIRAEAQAAILCEARLERRGDALVPRLESVDGPAREVVEPLLDLLRRIEGAIGRSPGGAPWFDALVDARTALGPAAGDPVHKQRDLDAVPIRAVNRDRYPADS